MITIGLETAELLVLDEKGGETMAEKSREQKEDTITMERREMNVQIVDEVKRIRRVLLGENGNREDGLLFQFDELNSDVRKVILPKMAAIEKLAWAILTAVLIAATIWVLSQAFGGSSASQTIHEIQIMLVTATPTP